MVYQWKRGSRIKADAQTAGEVCQRLESAGRLTPVDLVEESRPENAPLHGAFEWNDTIAAEKYRETQAGHIIRCLVTVGEESEPITRSFVSITVGDSAGTYMETRKALINPVTRDSVLKKALEELRSFERKYRDLSELADVLAAIREVA